MIFNSPLKSFLITATPVSLKGLGRPNLTCRLVSSIRSSISAEMISPGTIDDPTVEGKLSALKSEGQLYISPEYVDPHPDVQGIEILGALRVFLKVLLEDIREHDGQSIRISTWRKPDLRHR